MLDKCTEMKYTVKDNDDASKVPGWSNPAKRTRAAALLVLMGSSDLWSGGGRDSDWLFVAFFCCDFVGPAAAVCALCFLASSTFSLRVTPVARLVDCSGGFCVCVCVLQGQLETTPLHAK